MCLLGNLGADKDRDTNNKSNRNVETNTYSIYNVPNPVLKHFTHSNSLNT